MNKVEKIREEVEIVVNRRLNLLNGDYFDLNREVDGFTNEIMDIIDSLQEEPVSNDLEEAAHSYVDTTIEWFDSEGNPCCYPAFIAGAQWQKERDQSTIELAEDHAMLAGMEKMKQEIIDKAMVWLTSNMKWGVVSWDDKEECVRNFKDAMLLS